MDLVKFSMIQKYSIALITFVLLCGSNLTKAQSFRSNGRSHQEFRNNNIDNSPGMHRIESIKINYITEKMNLSAEESDKFRPLYSQYQRELNTVLHEKRQNMMNSQKSSQDIINDNFDYDSKILSIKKHYNQEFSRILSPDKLKQLWVSEREFNDEMIQRLRHGRDNDE